MMRGGVWIAALLLLPPLPACAPKRNEWQDLDYRAVYKHYYDREFDRGYTPPTTLGCIDEDLYNCK